MRRNQFCFKTPVNFMVKFQLTGAHVTKSTICANLKMLITPLVLQCLTQGFKITSVQQATKYMRNFSKFFVEGKGTKSYLCTNETSRFYREIARKRKCSYKWVCHTEIQSTYPMINRRCQPTQLCSRCHHIQQNLCENAKISKFVKT